ncbi:MAG: DUF615 domain-containing protein [Desulfovibrio sp.]|nr:DUF615 domain-containing protein [Desulfovibrio sp.]
MRADTLPPTPQDPQPPLSRSAKKRQATALQRLGEALLTLSPSERAEFNLPDPLLSALDHCTRLTKKEAIRRQKQYIGKLMRDLDEESLDSLTVALANKKNA